MMKRQVELGIGAALLVAALVFLQSGSAFAGIHTWDVNEVFSNANGTIQFIELWEADGGAGETGVGNGAVSSGQRNFSWSNGPVAPPTTNKFYLIATQGFADLPGAPTPDVILPANLLPYFFKATGDTVSFLSWDDWPFGAIPTDGINSLDRFTGEGPNTPTNYAGDTGTVDASVLVPVSSSYTVALVVALLTLAAMAILMSRRQQPV